MLQCERERSFQDLNQGVIEGEGKGSASDPRNQADDDNSTKILQVLEQCQWGRLLCSRAAPGEAARREALLKLPASHCPATANRLDCLTLIRRRFPCRRVGHRRYAVGDDDHWVAL